MTWLKGCRNAFAVMGSFFLPVTDSTAQEATTSQQSPSVPSHQAEFFRKATNGSVFIYRPDIDPCGTFSSELLPLGSAFVLGIEKKGTSQSLWNGWKFLVTAKHVLAGQSSIQIRLNSTHELKFVCKKIELQLQGRGKNILFAPDGVDLVAVSLPDIADSDPTVITSSLLIDQAKMKEWNIGVGTEVLTIGYLYGFGGLSANYPVVKFGHISLITDESWYATPDSHVMEKGYVLDLSNAPGLSGAPVLTHGIEFETGPFRFRELPPYLVGVVKGLKVVPINNNQVISQGIAVIEPGENVKALVRQIAASLKAGGADVAEID